MGVPDSAIRERDVGLGRLPADSPSQAETGQGAVLLIQVVEPQQDSAEVHFGLSLMALGTEGRWQ